MGSRFIGNQKHLSFFVHNFEKVATSLLVKIGSVAVVKVIFRWIKSLYSFVLLQSSTRLAKVPAGFCLSQPTW